MEIAKFIFTAIGTFISVSGLSFAVFQYWKKKQDERFAEMKEQTEKAVTRLGQRLESIELNFARVIEGRLSHIEGLLNSHKLILQAIQNWFFNNKQ